MENKFIIQLSSLAFGANAWSLMHPSLLWVYGYGWFVRTGGYKTANLGTAQIFDKAFNCGDLYITIYEISDSTKEVITQSGFLNQCYGSVNNYLPIDQEYSEILTEKGEYEILVEIYNTTYKQTNSLTANIIVN